MKFYRWSQVFVLVCVCLGPSLAYSKIVEEGFPFKVNDAFRPSFGASIFAELRLADFSLNGPTKEYYDKFQTPMFTGKEDPVFGSTLIRDSYFKRFDGADGFVSLNAQVDMAKGIISLEARARRGKALTEEHPVTSFSNDIRAGIDFGDTLYIYNPKYIEEGKKASQLPLSMVSLEIDDFGSAIGDAPDVQAFIKASVYRNVTKLHRMDSGSKTINVRNGGSEISKYSKVTPFKFQGASAVVKIDGGIRTTALANAPKPDTAGSSSIHVQFGLRSLPDGYICVSQSGVFPGCDDPLPVVKVEEKEPVIENIIVLTHGFQPSVLGIEPRDRLSRLSEVRAAIDKRLEKEGLTAETYVYEHLWGGAFQNFLFYYISQMHTFYEGQLLAMHIDSFIKRQKEKLGDPNYAPKIHIIGHSLGTMVNAVATGVLYARGISVEQVTMLETPLAPKSRAEGRRVDLLSIDPVNLWEHESFYYSYMPKGSAQYVENFYTEISVRTARLNFPVLYPVVVDVQLVVFGQAIDGMGPCGPKPKTECSGHLLPYMNHNTVHNEFYAGLVEGTKTDLNGDGWNSPVLPDWKIQIPWNPDLRQ